LAAPFPTMAGKATRDNAARMKLERRAIREITAALQSQLNNALRGDKTPSAVTDKLDKYGQPLWNALRRTLLDGAMLGVTELMDRLSAPVKAIPEEIQFDGVDWELVNEEVRDWVLGPDMGDIPVGERGNGYLKELYDQINQTSGKTLRRHMADWIESGEHLDVLKRDLEPMFGKSRAKRIAVTEITRSFVEGNIKTWHASGLVEQDPTQRPPLHVSCRCDLDLEEREPGVWHWIWLTANDGNVCPLCDPLHNTSVGIAKVLPQEQGAVAGAPVVPVVPVDVEEVPEFATMAEAEEWARTHLQSRVSGFKGASRQHVNDSIRTLAEIEQRMTDSPGADVVFGKMPRWSYAAYDWTDKKLVLKKRANWNKIAERMAEDNNTWRATYNTDTPYTVGTTYSDTIWHEYAHMLDARSGGVGNQIVQRLPLAEKRRLLEMSGYAGQDMYNMHRPGREGFAEAFAAIAISSDRARYVPDELREFIEGLLQ